jgi:hypothetical protein
MGRPTLVSWLLATGAVAAFLAHEPLLVLLGQRGQRALDEAGPRARRVAGGLLAVAAAGGGLALTLAPAEVRLAVTAPVVLAALLVPLVLRREEKTALGELLAAAALSGAGLPIAVAGGVPLAHAGAAWGAWLAALSASTVAVRHVIARHKQRREPLALPVLAAATLATLAGLASHRTLLAAAPMLAGAWFLFLRPPSPRHLKRVGWTLVGLGATSAALLVLLYRAAEGR